MQILIALAAQADQVSRPTEATPGSYRPQRPWSSRHALGAHHDHLARAQAFTGSYPRLEPESLGTVKHQPNTPRQRSAEPRQPPLMTPLNDVSDSGGWLTRQPGHPGRLPASRVARPHPRRRPGHARHHPRRHPVAHPLLPHPARPAPPAPRRPPCRSGTPVRSAADDPAESLQPRRHPGRPPAHPGRLPPRRPGRHYRTRQHDTARHRPQRRADHHRPRNSLGETTRFKAYRARHSP